MTTLTRTLMLGAALVAGPAMAKTMTCGFSLNGVDLLAPDQRELLNEKTTVFAGEGDLASYSVEINDENETAKAHLVDKRTGAKATSFVNKMDADDNGDSIQLKLEAAEFPEAPIELKCKVD